MTLLGDVASSVEEYNAFVAREVGRARSDAPFTASSDWLHSQAVDATG